MLVWEDKTAKNCSYYRTHLPLINYLKTQNCMFRAIVQKHDWKLIYFLKISMFHKHRPKNVYNSLTQKISIMHT